MRSDVILGSLFPYYELSDHTGRRRKLSEKDPMIALILSDG